VVEGVESPPDQERERRYPASGRLPVATRALAGGRRTLTPTSGRLMPASSGLTGRRWKRAAANRNRTGEGGIAQLQAGPVARVPGCSPRPGSEPATWSREVLGRGTPSLLGGSAHGLGAGTGATAALGMRCGKNDFVRHARIPRLATPACTPLFASEGLARMPQIRPIVPQKHPIA